MRTIRLLLLTSLTLILLIPPFNSAWGEQKGKGPIKIALIFPFTGVGADHGRPAPRGQRRVRCRFPWRRWPIPSSRKSPPRAMKRKRMSLKTPPNSARTTMCPTSSRRRTKRRSRKGIGARTGSVGHPPSQGRPALAAGRPCRIFRLNRVGRLPRFAAVDGPALPASIFRVGFAQVAGRERPSVPPDSRVSGP